MSPSLHCRALPDSTPLGRGFYQNETVTVARSLLGRLLLRQLPEGLAAVRLVEVEAYLGVEDPAAHTFRGRRTDRVRSMWGEAGHLYVYFTYGMHHCANVVTRGPEVPEAVLLRGARPVAGVEAMLARRHGRGGASLLDGPAKLCQALDIDRALDGADLVAPGRVWIADDGFRFDPGLVISGPRIGVGYAGEAARWPLRFRLSPDAFR